MSTRLRSLVEHGEFTLASIKHQRRFYDYYFYLTSESQIQTLTGAYLEQSNVLIC